MVLTLVRFTLAAPLADAEILRRFHEIAASYRGRPDFVAKHFIVSTDRHTVGGAYLFRSRDDAERAFDAAWRLAAERRWGAPAEIAWYEVPLSIESTEPALADAAARSATGGATGSAIG